jgi:GAF domain-containing protein
MSPDVRAEALQALSRFVVSDQSMSETLLRVSDLTTQAMPNADLAGISLLNDSGKPTTAIFTDEAAPEIDAGQYESGQGPCLDAWRLGKVVRIDVMDEATEEYPEFARLAMEHGVQSTLSLPLIAGDRGVGALNLYAHVEHGFSRDDEAIGAELSAAAAIVLANATAYWEASQLGEQLTQAMASRAVIEQAKGMLMAQSPELTPDGAFDLLRRASQRENVKLRDIAQRLVDRRAAPPAKS